MPEMLKSLVREVARFGVRRRVLAAERLRRAGDPRAALRRLDDAIDAEALAARGLALRDLGHTKGAIEALEKSLKAGGEDAEILNELGLLVLAEGDRALAQEMFERSAKLAPRLAAPLANLAVMHLRSTRPLDAVPLLQKAVHLAPDAVEHRVNLALAYRDAGEMEEARSRLAEAESRFPGSAVVQRNLAMLEREAGSTIRAQDRLERLLRDHPGDAASRKLLGMVMQDRGNYAGARRCFDSVLEGDPREPEARFLRGVLALAQGDFSAGWDDYEARFMTDESPERNFGYPAWNGNAIDGNLLAYAEQGIGDEIMFASCFRDAAQRCSRLFVQCDPRLASLFARSFPEATIVGAARTDASWITTVPSIGAKVAVGSLPSFFRRDPAAFEERTPFLRADPERIEHWRQRLEKSGPGPYVGLSWRGGMARTRQVVRSLSVESLGPLLEASSTWISLQHDAHPSEIAMLGAMAPLQAWPQALADLDEAAALICALDHVVSVCNATVHLTGALGRPGTVLVPSAPEWRYGVRGERMPWYPSLTLIRQEEGQGWARVLRLAASRVGGGE